MTGDSSLKGVVRCRRDYECRIARQALRRGELTLVKRRQENPAIHRAQG
ncbi:hypothetical protein PCO31110_04564 [Pandoraea communis]|uniref:Uncharacterized protein n=1 Tax=Pandoraea communis TaxID=2508297 RepID=A0A5E4YG91_9BURK|nr:hypothetical protein PCO31110_04564 [Pandoraea communis]